MVNNTSFNKNTMSILLSIATNTNSVERKNKNKTNVAPKEIVMALKG